MLHNKIYCLLFGGISLILALGFVVIAYLALTDEIIAPPNSEEVPAVLTKREVKNALERGAACSDGSPAIYYLRSGSNGNQDKWIIWLKGGGGCADDQTCQRRLKNEILETSSTTASDTQTPAGILSPDSTLNPDFYSWNHVMIHYCSSDTWTGDTIRTWEGGQIVFHGDKIFNAVIEDLNLKTAEEVLLTGSSGGGTGALHQLDDLAAQLPNVRVTGVIDSSWEVDYTAFKPEYDSLAYAKQAQAYRHNQVDASCAAAHPNEPYLCFTDTVVKPFISTPMFIFINQYDRAKAGALGITNYRSPEQKAYLDDHAAAIRESLKNFDGVFSPAGNLHTILIEDAYHEVNIEGTTFEEVFTNWYFDRSGPTKLIEN